MNTIRGGVIQGCFPNGPARVNNRSVIAPAPQPAKVSGPRPPVANLVQGKLRPGAISGWPGNSAIVPLPANLPRPNFGNAGGQQLPAIVRTKMEAAFGASFADVRIHIAPEATSIGALAFTQGNNLYFAPGQYNPHTPQGQQLLAHELTHVVQQRAGRVRNPAGSGTVIVQNAALDGEAQRMARRAMLMPGKIVQGKPNAIAQSHPFAQNGRTPMGHLAVQRVPTTSMLPAGTNKNMGLPASMRSMVESKAVPRFGNSPRSAIQRASRRGFSSPTLSAVPIAKGEHRRHIIPNSLMKDAINNWNAVRKAWSPSQAQALLDKLNNYVPNLIAGEGVGNMAAGGIMHQAQKIESKLGDLSDAGDISDLMQDEFPKVAAFGGTKSARALVGEVVPAVDDMSDADEMKEFAVDIGDSGAFDWPTPDNPRKAPALFMAWHGVYLGFVFMRDNPRKMSSADVEKLFAAFLNLKAPAKHH